MTYNTDPFQVEYYTTPSGNGTGKEMSKAFTPNQEQAIDRQFGRLEKYGRGLGNNFFRKVKGSKKGIEEFRLTGDKVEPRFLFSFESPNIFLMLVCYKEQGGTIPPNKIKTAENRLEEWRKGRVTK